MRSLFSSIAALSLAFPGAAALTMAPVVTMLMTTSPADARFRGGIHGGFHGGFGGGFRGGFGSFHRGFGGGFHNGEVASWGRHSLNDEVFRAGRFGNGRNVNGHYTNIDVNHHYHYAYRYPYGYYGYGAAAAALAIGTTVATLPANCTGFDYGGAFYHRCGDVWYEPQYSGADVTYVVVNPPR